MNKKTKAWLISASVLTALGLIIFAAVMTVCDWDFAKLGTVTYVTETYKADGDFEKISVNAETSDIEFIPADDGKCTVECFESEKVKHSVSVKDGTLVIETTDTRKWYEHICISFVQPKVSVYLPKSEYASLSVETDTGNITVPRDFSFENIGISGDTSDVDCRAAAADTVEIKVTAGGIVMDGLSAERLNLTSATGDIRVNSAAVGADIGIKTNTGNVKLTDTFCSDILAETDTGNITFKNVEAAGGISARSDTGNVGFEDSDAENIIVRTSTGNVTGTLLSEKVFVTKTSVGKVSVPRTVSGGKCEITTSTGDIRIDIRK